MENITAITETLNDLVEINNDRINGYDKAVNDTHDDEELKDIFTNMIKQSHRFKMELGTEIEVLGKDIETGTTTSGKLHRAWLHVKSAFSEDNSKSILEECEFGEDAIKKAYNSALNEDNLPAYIRDILSAQYSELLITHNEIKALRDNI